MQISDLPLFLEKALNPRWAVSESNQKVLRGIQYDSRCVLPGDLFVAMRGNETDGHLFLEDAKQAGAAAVLVEKEPSEDLGLPVLVVDNCRLALAQLSAPFFGSPAKELDLIGITGTNGKTTTSVLTETIIKEANRKVGLIGTLGIRYANERIESINTTPESLEIQRTLRRMCNFDIGSVVMEVSSHGLKLERVEGCDFRVAAISNLSQDHLDFHQDMKSYAEAKQILFKRYLQKNGTAVINISDPSTLDFVEIVARRGIRIIKVSKVEMPEADIFCENFVCGSDSTTMKVSTPGGSFETQIPLIGTFNVENSLLAIGIGFALGIPNGTIGRGLANCPQVPGRMERIEGNSSQPRVFVDYAHTPDALEKILSTLRPLSDGRLIVVFGCGGDRDRSKRVEMGKSVAKNADIALLTSDNPRTEDPSNILRDVEKGLSSLRQYERTELPLCNPGYTRILDRKDAILAAISLGKPNDIVVIAGKGHEDYQIIGTRRYPFDDREEAREALRKNIL